MATELLDIEGTEFELKGDELQNIETQLPPGVHFPRQPAWEEINPDRPKGRQIIFEADLAMGLPFAQKIVTLASRAYTLFKSTFHGWEWYRQAVYESPDVVEVAWWPDKRFFRIEWTLIPPPEEFGALPLVALIPVLAVIAKVLMAAAAFLGGLTLFVVLAVRVKKPTLALGLIAVIVVGTLLLLGKRD